MKMTCKRPWRLPSLALTVALAAALAGCGAEPMKRIRLQEDFSSTQTYSRLFDASPAQTCEAARRALLSQGYMIDPLGEHATLVEGRKSFQPEAEVHLQMFIRVVCLPENAQQSISLGFVTALQDRYALKKSANSASLGVGGLGSVSLPLAASHESMVKVGSETIASDAFYESFFDLVKRFQQPEELPEELPEE